MRKKNPMGLSNKTRPAKGKGARKGKKIPYPNNY